MPRTSVAIAAENGTCDFESVGFQYVDANTRLMKLDTKTWEAKVGETAGECVITCPEGTETVIISTIDKAFDGLIQHYFHKRVTLIDYFWFHEFFPAIPAGVTADLTYFKTAGQSYTPEIGIYLRKAAKNNNLVIEVMNSQGSAMLTELQDVKANDLEIITHECFSLDGMLAVNAKRLGITEHYDSEDFPVERFLAYVQNLAQKPFKLESSYRIMLPSPVAEGILLNQEFKNEIANMNGEILQDGALYLIELPKKKEVVISIHKNKQVDPFITVDTEKSTLLVDLRQQGHGEEMKLKLEAEAASRSANERGAQEQVDQGADEPMNED